MRSDSRSGEPHTVNASPGAISIDCERIERRPRGRHMVGGKFLPTLPVNLEINLLGNAVDPTARDGKRHGRPRLGKRSAGLKIEPEQIARLTAQDHTRRRTACSTVGNAAAPINCMLRLSHTTTSARPSRSSPISRSRNTLQQRAPDRKIHCVRQPPRRPQQPRD